MQPLQDPNEIPPLRLGRFEAQLRLLLDWKEWTNIPNLIVFATAAFLMLAHFLFLLCPHFFIKYKHLNGNEAHPLAIFAKA